MKSKPSPELERYRIVRMPLASSKADGNNGAFMLSYKDTALKAIISDGMGWDHVSVSTPFRCPTWDEMHYVKRLFWRDDETVVQFHPPKRLYVDDNPFCLHLWRSQKQEVLLPPTQCVGITLKGT